MITDARSARARELLQRLPPAGDQRELGALLRRPQCHRPADARRGADHDDLLPRESPGHREDAIPQRSTHLLGRRYSALRAFLGGDTMSDLYWDPFTPELRDDPVPVVEADARRGAGLAQRPLRLLGADAVPRHRSGRTRTTPRSARPTARPWRRWPSEPIRHRDDHLDRSAQAHEAAQPRVPGVHRPARVVARGRASARSAASSSTRTWASSRSTTCRTSRRSSRPR